MPHGEITCSIAQGDLTILVEFYARRRLALEAGLSSTIAGAISANQRPASMAKDEETVYDFVSELLATGRVSDAAFQRIKDAFGELRSATTPVSMTPNVAQVPLPPRVTPPLEGALCRL